MSDQQNPALTSALSLASTGFAVFPMHEPLLGGCSCGQPQCANPGKHPRTKKGFRAASTDPKTIRAWWRRYPTANVGIATGRTSDLVVIDVDPRHLGDESFDTLLAGCGETWPLTRTVLTGNGTHYYFRTPAFLIASSSGALGKGIDVRAEKGCVVAPPSMHKCGKRYEFIDADAPILELPSWLVERLNSQRSFENKSSTGSALIAAGSRNDSLTSYAGSLRARGYDWEQIHEALRHYNATSCAEPLPESQILRISYSVARYPAGTPFVAPSRSTPGVENPLWWFPFSIRRWFHSLEILRMTAEQMGWYIQLKALAWANQGQLPSETETLWGLVKARSAADF